MWKKAGLASVLAASLLAGCAVGSSRGERPIAEDPVCLYNRDLGCVRVLVEEETPRAIHGGTTYYFCSEACREAFESAPERYLAGKE